jgi:hypothetical protein
VPGPRGRWNAERAPSMPLVPTGRPIQCRSAWMQRRHLPAHPVADEPRRPDHGTGESRPQPTCSSNSAALFDGFLGRKFPAANRQLVHSTTATAPPSASRSEERIPSDRQDLGIIRMSDRRYGLSPASSQRYGYQDDQASRAADQRPKPYQRRLDGLSTPEQSTRANIRWLDAE